MKKPGKKTGLILTLSLLTLAGLFYGGWRLGRATNSVQLQVFPDDATNARIVEREGVVLYEVRGVGGTWRTMTPEAFTEAVWQNHESHTLGQRLLLRSLNISSTATIGWVAIGLLGQILFAGRMIVQWLVSEKAHESIIPPSFWWMALAGATLLMIYFIWRKDAVGILGQATGWLIYSRNLYFIYSEQKNPASDDEHEAVSS